MRGPGFDTVQQRNADGPRATPFVGSGQGGAVFAVSRRLEHPGRRRAGCANVGARRCERLGISISRESMFEGFTRGYATIDGTDIAYVIGGSRPPVAVL